MYDGRPHVIGAAKYTYSPSMDALSGQTASRTNSYAIPIKPPTAHIIITAVRIRFVYCFSAPTAFFIFLPMSKYYDVVHSP